MKLSTIEQTMTSVDIATLTEKRHNDVLRDIREMFNGLEIDARTFARVYLGGNNQQRPMYELDRELTHCLLTGYSAKARMKVIKRWHELEKGKTPTTFIEALELTLAQAKAIEEKEAALLIASPKAEMYDYIADGAYKILQDASKDMGLKMGVLPRVAEKLGWVSETRILQPGNSHTISPCNRHSLDEGYMVMSHHTKLSGGRTFKYKTFPYLTLDGYNRLEDLATSFHEGCKFEVYGAHGSYELDELFCENDFK